MTLSSHSSAAPIICRTSRNKYLPVAYFILGLPSQVEKNATWVLKSELILFFTVAALLLVDDQYIIVNFRTGRPNSCEGKLAGGCHANCKLFNLTLCQSMGTHVYDNRHLSYCRRNNIILL